MEGAKFEEVTEEIPGKVRRNKSLRFRRLPHEVHFSRRQRSRLPFRGLHCRWSLRGARHSLSFLPLHAPSLGTILFRHKGVAGPTAYDCEGVEFLEVLLKKPTSFAHLCAASGYHHLCMLRPRPQQTLVGEGPIVQVLDTHALHCMGKKAPEYLPHFRRPLEKQLHGRREQRRLDHALSPHPSDQGISIYVGVPLRVLLPAGLRGPRAQRHDLIQRA